MCVCVCVCELLLAFKENLLDKNCSLILCICLITNYLLIISVCKAIGYKITLQIGDCYFRFLFRLL